MAFSKSFPKTVKGSTYPQWEEVALTEAEEKLVEKKSKEENTKLMKDCIIEAKKIVIEQGLQPYQSDIISMAIALFEKQASHSIYLKESKAKEKFDAKEK